MEESEYIKRREKLEQWWETLRSELVIIISKSPPKTIYHYTDINGLLGMLETSKIWATHVSRLNDTSEYRHGKNIVEDCIRMDTPSSSKPLINKILSEYREAETYIASYSTEFDLLSQWRSYSGAKVGYCLGLSTDGIATIDDSTPLLEPVIYDESVARQVISRILISVDEYLQGNQFGEVEVGYLLGIVGSTLANLACTIKHSTFSEENEYRQFYQSDTTSLKLEIKFRNGNFGLTPYVEFPFKESGRLPLSSITIGPCFDKELEMNVVKMLLEKYSYKNIDVLVSEIPLRT